MQRNFIPETQNGTHRSRSGRAAAAFRSLGNLIAFARQTVRPRGIGSGTVLASPMRQRSHGQQTSRDRMIPLIRSRSGPGGACVENAIRHSERFGNQGISATCIELPNCEQMASIGGRWDVYEGR